MASGKFVQRFNVRAGRQCAKEMMIHREGERGRKE